MDGQTQRIASQVRMLNLERLNKSSIATQPARVRQMFGSIARRYDLANHVLSCGADFYWRSHAAQIIARWTPENIVDLATGTGDLAVAIMKKSSPLMFWLKCWNWRRKKACSEPSWLMR